MKNNIITKQVMTYSLHTCTVYTIRVAYQDHILLGIFSDL